MTAGRPSDYSRELAEEICEQIATTQKGIATILAEKDGYPTEKTFYNWLNSENAEFLQLYARSKQRQADKMASEMLEIADETSRDTILTPEGLQIPNHEWINRSRLRVDTRKWLMSKLLPKKYGDKLDVTSGDEPIKTFDLTLTIPAPRKDEG